MDNESIFGAIIMILCCWSCAALFVGIALHGRKKQTPMGFWSGTSVDSCSVRDIPGYNRENSNMWLIYSVPYWICGMVSFFWGAGDFIAIIAVGILMFACIPGLAILIGRYKQIERKYIIPKSLDKNDPIC